MATTPDGLSDLVHWLNADDATTIVDAGSDGDVDQWLDMSGAANHASQGTSGSQPQIVSSGINGRTAIGFDGADDRLDVADDATLNTGGPYSGKTLMMAFRTGNDVSGRQVLYEQGGSSRGLNLYVDNGQIYLNGWNLAETAWGPSFANSAVSPNTTYVATFVFDQAAGTVEGFIDGSSIGSVSGVSFLNGHTGDIGLGAVSGGTLYHDGTSSTSSNTFSGLIGEFVQYNQALSDVDRAGVEAYLQDRWQGVANQLPTAGNDSGSTTEDSAVTIAVLDNDTDSDGGSPTVSGVDTAGTVGSVTNNGSDVTYDPNGGFESLGAGVTATDTFKYTVADGQGGTDTATVTVTVTGLNDAPVAIDDNGSTDKDTSFTTANVLANDSDIDSTDTLSVTGFDTTGTLGQVTNNGNGTFSYDPNGQFDGLGDGASATDTFSYTLTDGNGGSDTATVTVTVNGGTVVAGTAPDSVSDLVMWLDADDGATITDTGSDGDVDLWSDKSGQGNHASETTSGSQPSIDVGGINGRTAIGFDGSNDGLDVADDATLNTGGPYAGKTLMMAFRTGEDETSRQVLYEQGGQNRGLNVYIDTGQIYLNGWNVLETAWGPSFASATVTPKNTYVATFVFDQAAGTVEGFLNGASIGSVSGVSFLNSHSQNIGVGATRESTRFHDGAVSGDGHTFDGRIGELVQYNRALTDVERSGVEAYLQDRWQGVVNQQPTAGNDSGSTTEDSAVTITVLDNDTDADGGTPTVSGVDTAGTVGSVTNNGSDVTYDPNGGFESLGVGVMATDTFKYTIADGQGGADTATVTVTVTGLNDDPTSLNDNGGSTDQAATFTTANVLVNDSDPDTSDTLSVTGFNTSGTTGQVTNNSDGTFAYDPNGQFNGLSNGASATDTFNYTLTDGNGGTDTATVTVTITSPGNLPPDAVDDNAVATEGFVTAGIDVLANDSDPEDGSAVIYVGSDVTGTVGNVTDHGDGTFTYDAQGLFEELSNGATTTDTFRYTISDSAGATDTATVTVVVSGDNDQPDAVDDTATVAWDATLGSIDVLVNDSDIDSADTLSVTGFDVTGTLGQVSNNGDGTFAYDPNGAFDGLGAGVSATDTFTYTIGDAQGGNDTATVTVTVNGGTVVAGTAPDSVSDLVQWLDADDGSTITDSGGDNDVDVWSDKSGQGNHASETTSGSQPSIDAAGINGRTAIGFDGSNDGLDVADDTTLNTGGPYSGKTLMMAFRTGSDVTGRQVLYEQGGGTRGINFYIFNNELYLNGWNLAETAWGPSFAKAAVTANTTYVATFVFDQAAGTVEGFLDGTSIGSVSGVSVLNSHSENIGIGAARQNTVFHDGSFSGDGLTFGGRIGEFVHYNRALADVEQAGVEAYLQDRWQGVANLPPDAVDDSGSTTEDSAVTITVLDNDSDADGGSPAVSGVNTSGTVGSVTNNGSDVTYDPNGGFDSLGAGVTATDTFKYTVADGQGGTDTATVTVTVTGLNDAPVALDDSGLTDKV
jgi:VCBS repeat-containing protein